MKTVRIFISSPGDVFDERDRSKLVVEELRRRYIGQLDLRTVLWEDLPLQATTSFQQGIDVVLAEHGVDVAIFILWSRLGTPLGALIRKPDGTEYCSGTEREWDLMLRAREQSCDGRPHIFVYVRRDEPSFDERLRSISTEDKRRLIEQKALVEQFIADEFHDATGANIHAYHSFDRAAAFTQRLRVHLEELLDQLTGLDRTRTVWDVAEHGPPFVGLDSFESRHAPVFFGREDEIVALRTLLREQARRGCAFVLIAGASGSGKSSIARAGLLPAVSVNEIDSDVAGWRTAAFTPAAGEGQPLESLARALMSATALPALNTGPDALADLGSDFSRDPEMVCRRVLRPALQQDCPRHRLIVLVDQLEEIFTDPRVTPEMRTSFCRGLEALARSGYTWIVATVRSDFYAQYQSIDALVRMTEGGGRFDLLPPDADALNRLIRQPAALAGLRFEQRGDTSLGDVILRDATAHRELLPLLEYLLNRLCADMTPAGVLTFASYEALGGVEGALARRADAVISKLQPTESTLDALLSALATVRGDDQDTIVRRRVPRTELGRDDASRTLVSALIDERLLTSSSSPVSQPMITVAHEALFRVWPEAAAWLTRNREFVRLRASVTESFARWQSAGEHESLLLPIGLPLDEAGRLSAIEAGRLEAPVRDYIEMSVARADALVENDRAQALAISERNSFLEQLNCAIRSTMFDALLLLRTERKVTTRERDPQYSDFLKVDASREQALTDLAMIDALLTGGGRWHPQAAEHRHSFGADGDYAEGWEFPCCGKKTVTFDERPNQISDSGCSAIISQASSQFRLSSQHVEVLWHGIEARLSRGVGIMTEVRYLDELLQLIQGQVKEEPALSQLNAVGDQIAARLTPLVPISIEKDVTRFHVWRREATCVYETLGEWASTRKQWQAAEAEFTRAYETAQSVEDHSPRSKADIDRTRNNLARVHQQRGQSA